jgi:hypothetical protein
MVSLDASAVLASGQSCEQRCRPGEGFVQAHAGKLLSSGATGLASTFRRIKEEESDNSEDRPSAHALKTARALLADAQTAAPILVDASVVESFEGSMIIHWDAPGRGVALIVPATPEGKVKLYREKLTGNQAIWSKLTEEPSPSYIASSLQWVR